MVLIEACEERGSYDLPAYVDHLADAHRQAVAGGCLDSGCGNYEQLWCTTSLRGLVGGNLTVEVLDRRRALGRRERHRAVELPHAARSCSSRIEDEDTGRILLDGLHVEIPAERLAQARDAAEVLGDEVYDKFPFLPRHEADGATTSPSWCSTAPGGRRCR